MNETGNDNKQLSRKPSMEEVDDLAQELCKQFNNYGYFKWYCSIIWKLGIDRVKELQGRVRDAKLAGRLFTKYVEEDVRRLESQQKLKDLRAKEEDQPTS